MKRTLFVGITIAVLCGAAGCVRDTVTSPDTFENTTILSGQPDSSRPALPGFPPDVSNSPEARFISDETLELTGLEYTEQVGVNNRNSEKTPGAYSLIPGADDDLAWGRWSFTVLTGDRPVSVSLGIEPTAFLPGGDDDLPLSYWVGLTDFTTFSWVWYGPYTDSGTLNIEINGDGTSNDRFVSETGAMSLAIKPDSSLVNPSPSNPDGLSAVSVISVATTTSADYETNTPHYPPVEDPEQGASGVSGIKGFSAPVPDRYVSIGWRHIPPFNLMDLPSAASTYEIYRRRADEQTFMQIGTVIAPLEVFLNFVVKPGEIPPVADMVPGQTYVFAVRAVNSAGKSPFVETPPITIPMLPPEEVRAELNAAGDEVDISWSEVAGAVTYTVLKRLNDDAEPMEFATGITESSYLDAGLAEADFGHYSIIALGEDVESLASAESSVFMPSEMSMELAPGVMLDFVYVPDGFVQLGSPVTEWSRIAENEGPYQTVAMNHFYISKTEITNEMFAAFIDAGGYSDTYFEIDWNFILTNSIFEPPFWSTGEHNNGTDFPDHPVTGLSWPEAHAFCKWVESMTDPAAEVQLPSEDEWEYAAEGSTAPGEVWLYPWQELGPLNGGLLNNGGDDADMTRANSVLDLLPDIWTLESAEVGSLPLGRSWCGALDMSGNAYEWTDENWRVTYPLPWEASYYDAAPTTITIRGGSFNSGPTSMRTSYRTGFNPAGSQIGNPAFPIGFRCVLIPPE